MEVQESDGLMLARLPNAESIFTDTGSCSLNPLIEASRGKPVLVDFAAVGFITSSAVGLLLHFLVAAEKQKVPTALFGANDLVGKIFSVAGVDEITRVFETEAEARAAFV